MSEADSVREMWLERNKTVKNDCILYVEECIEDLIKFPSKEAYFIIMGICKGLFAAGVLDLSEASKLEGKADKVMKFKWAENKEEKTVSQAASAMGKRGGSKKSETKSASSRANGKLGGRPRKVKDA